MGCIKNVLGTDTLGNERSRSEFGPQELPNLLTRERGAELVEQAVSRTGGRSPFNEFLQGALTKRNPFGSAVERFGLNPATSPFAGRIQNRILNQGGSPFQTALNDAILNPTFGARSEAEQNLIDQTFSERQGQFNALGIGDSPASQSAVAAAGAGTLSQLRQNQIANLFAGQGQFAGEQQRTLGNLLAGESQFQSGQEGLFRRLLEGFGGFESERGLTGQLALGGVGTDLASQELDINTLLASARFGQPIVARRGSSEGPQEGIINQASDVSAQQAGAFGDVAGGIAAFCWIAEAIYGAYTEEFYLARHWIRDEWKGEVADIVRGLYLKYGERMAEIVKRSETLKAIIKPFFDWAVRMGEESLNASR